MPSKRKTSWNAEDNERLQWMVANGVSALRAAAAFKCSMDAVRVQARKVGTPFPSVRDAKKTRLALETRSEHLRAT
jgi:hypothetical protein